MKNSVLVLLVFTVIILHAKTCHSTHLAYTLLDKVVNILFSKPESGQVQK